MTILVTGARGNVGPNVTLQAGLGVAKVSADLESPETLEAALDGIASVFLYTQRQGIDGFVKVAEAAGVRHVVLLSSAATLEPESAQSRIARLHRSVEEALAAAPFAETVLNPGSFATNTLG